MCFDFFSFFNVKYQAGCVEGEMPGIAVELYKTYAQLFSPLFLLLPHRTLGKIQPYTPFHQLLLPILNGASI